MQLTQQHFIPHCNILASTDATFQSIINQYGYPPFWTRPNSFATLVHIILEQQVSLASAKAAFNKLNQKLGKITPAKLAALNDEEMRSCYFSRQKIIYVRELASAILQKKIVLSRLEKQPDEAVRTVLKTIKGIGDWTVDVYLLFALQRSDVFPTGDLAMMNALKKLKQLPKASPKEMIIEIAENWRPYRSVATMLFWHWYIKEKGIKY